MWRPRAIPACIRSVRGSKCSRDVAELGSGVARDNLRRDTVGSYLGRTHLFDVTISLTNVE